MTLPRIQTTANSLSYLNRLQEVVANNLANASTDGFKVDRLTGANVAGTDWPVPVQHTDLRQGTFRETGRSLDLALQGDGFLVVQTPQGERLVRGGSFRLDGAGQVVDGQGNPLLGQKGPLVIPQGSVSIDGTGEVRVDGEPFDVLRRATVDDLTALKKEGSSRFLPGGPLKPAEGLVVRQGSIEEANGDTVLGMVDLVAIQRAYAANIDALKAMDGVLSTIANEVAK